MGLQRRRPKPENLQNRSTMFQVKRKIRLLRLAIGVLLSCVIVTTFFMITQVPLPSSSSLSERTDIYIKPRYMETSSKQQENQMIDTSFRASSLLTQQHSKKRTSARNIHDRTQKQQKVESKVDHDNHRLITTKTSQVDHRSSGVVAETVSLQSDTNNNGSDVDHMDTHAIRQYDTRRNRKRKQQQQLQQLRELHDSQPHVARTRQQLGLINAKDNHNNNNNNQSSTTDHKFQRPNVDVRIEMGSDMKTVVLQTKNLPPSSKLSSVQGNASINYETNENEWTDLLPTSGRTLLRSRNNNLQSPFLALDPLRNVTQSSKQSQRKLPIQPMVPYLGVLIDAGRHYFPIDWLVRVLDFLALMRYNLVHFRFTDDQAFNIRFESYPSLAYPSVTSMMDDDNNTARVYSPNEIRYFVQQAKERNIAVIPEVNIPGHVGAWAGIPDLVVTCPQFTCSHGYGLPLNTSHVDLPTILYNILKETIDIFDDPPFIHLGGDEVHMGDDCWKEYYQEQNYQQKLKDSLTSFNSTNKNKRFPLPPPSMQYDVLETQILPKVLSKLDYAEDRVIRWERSKENRIQIDEDNGELPRRFGGITHYWQSTPSPIGAEVDGGGGGRRDDTGGQKWIASAGLYFDIEHDADAWAFYRRSQYYLDADAIVAAQSANKKNSTLVAILAGTFELSSEYWLDRNVLGRLLAVAMGASSTEPDTSTTVEKKGYSTTDVVKSNYSSSDHMKSVYLDYCVNYLSIDLSLCNMFGKPTLDKLSYSQKWKDSWHQWKLGICYRLTEEVYQKKIVKLSIPANSASITIKANEIYWDSFGISTAKDTVSTSLAQDSGSNRAESFTDENKGNNELLLLLNETSVHYSGVILDPVAGYASPKRVGAIIDSVGRLGFNMLQLRVGTDNGFLLSLPSLPRLCYSPIQDYCFTEDEILRIVDEAHLAGLQVVPEISTTTNAGGWYKGGFLFDCPEILCGGGSSADKLGLSPMEVSPRPGVVSHNITDFSLLPVIATVIRDLRRIFSGDFLHLGSDERQSGIKCALESRDNENIQLADYGRFEQKLATLLKLEGVSLDRVVRWRNQEGVDYSDRTGEITMYKDNDSNMVSTSASNKDGHGNFFATIKLIGRGPWTIFQTTRDQALLSPTAILAEVGHLSEKQWNFTGMTQRLIAFAMGISKGIPKEIDRARFEETYGQLCDALNVPQCKEYAKEDFIPDRPLLVDMDHFVTKACERRTTEVRIRVPRGQAK